MTSLEIKDIKTTKAYNALRELIDKEIEVINNVKLAINARIAVDLNYSKELLRKIAPETNCLSGFVLEETWNVFETELRKYHNLVIENCEKLKSLIERIDKILNDKKELKKIMKDLIKKYNIEIKKLKFNFDKQKEDLQKNIKIFTNLRNDFNDPKRNSNKGNDIIGNATSNIAQTQHLHNMCLIAYHQLQKYKELCFERLYPILFSFVQANQERLIADYQNVLKEYYDHVNSSNEKYSPLFNNIKEALQKIKPGKTYSVDFKPNEIFANDALLVEVDVNYDIANYISEELLYSNNAALTLKINNKKNFVKEQGTLGAELLKKRCNEFLETIKCHDSEIKRLQNLKAEFTNKEASFEYLQLIRELKENEALQEYYLKLVDILSDKRKSSPVQVLEPDTETEPNLETDDNIKTFIIHSMELKDQPWFHGFVTVEKLNSILKESGDFLVRELRTIGEKMKRLENETLRVTHYVISLRKENELKNFLIIINPKTQKYGIEKEFTFDKVSQLIEYLMIEPNNDLQFQLLNPVFKSGWNIKDDEIKLIKELGEGEFGKVYKAFYFDKIVAVKSLKDEFESEQRQEFFREANILHNLRHDKIVRFIGMKLENNPIYMVMEFIDGGSLQSYLQSFRTDAERQQLRRSQKLKLCADCAEGMLYLEKNQIIHRDLAARNCLIEKKTNSLKIADFGLARMGSIYTLGSSKKIPFKWLAIEAITQHKFSSKSDTWAYGVTVWEIFNFGETPYPELRNAELKDFLMEGNRLTRPSDIMDGEIYDRLMYPCWLKNPDDRPNFSKILEIINGLVIYENGHKF